MIDQKVVGCQGGMMNKITIGNVEELFIPKEDYSDSHSIRKLTLVCRELSAKDPKQVTKNLEISISAMYGSPVEINFFFLKKVSELFETDKIDVDNWSKKGCETCDWGSNYGHTIQIYETPTDIKEILDKGAILGNKSRAFEGY